MDFKMRICNMTDIMEPGVGLKMVYTVEVAKGWFVDVMHVPKPGLRTSCRGKTAVRYMAAQKMMSPQT